MLGPEERLVPNARSNGNILINGKFRPNGKGPNRPPRNREEAGEKIGP